MSDKDEILGSITLPQPEEEALRLKALAVENYNSGDLNSALEYANRAHELHPSINGLPEMLMAFKILLAAASESISDSSSAAEKSTPDYYSILQVERFSHINSIKKQYKKLAMTLHPDKNPFQASEEAFKLVGEAARVLSDKIRRKEYDMRLRIAMQSKAAEEVGLGEEEAGEVFWTACSSCRLLHQFERKYLGHNLMCPRCKKTFTAVEVEEDANNGRDEGSVEKNEGVGGGQTRVSARIRERVEKGEHVGSVEKFGLGVKRKSSSVGEGSERLRKKVGTATRLEKDGNSGEGDGGGKDIGAMHVRSRRVGEKVRDGVEKTSKSGRVEIVESEGAKRIEDGEEESMTLFQMKMLMKKKKNVVDVEKLEAMEKEVDIEEDEDREKEIEIVREEQRQEEEEETEREEEKEKEKEMMNLREKTNRRRVSKDGKSGDVNDLHSEVMKDRSSRKRDLKEKDGKEKENEKEMVGTREKRERRRVSRYGNLNVVKPKTSKNHVDSKIERLIANEKGSLGIMPVEDSDFHDFDKDRRERSFKKGQVWAVYDDDDGMPRHYGLIDRIVSLSPFEVSFIWLRFKSNGDEALTSWPNTGFHVSCGIFQLSRKVTIKYLNLFSHLVECERAARELYRIYPKKGSVWAMYSNNAPEVEQTNVRDKDTRCYDIVVSLSSYNDVHGLSIGYLDKVPEFRTVFKRRQVGANAVICLGPKDVKAFSHQIPAKKLSGEESSDLPKDCWELDPASLTPQLLNMS